MNQSFHLVVAVAGNEPIVYQVTGDSMSIGRKPENDIQILVDQISSRHAQLVRTGSGYELVDPGSAATEPASAGNRSRMAASC